MQATLEQFIHLIEAQFCVVDAKTIEFALSLAVFTSPLFSVYLT
jgi:hypothetical protein